MKCEICGKEEYLFDATDLYTKRGAKHTGLFNMPYTHICQQCYFKELGKIYDKMKEEIKMPYIKQEDREDIDIIVDVNAYHLKCNGHLNYFICKLFLKLMRVNGGMTYNKAKEFIGELECAKLEIYRKFISPYEDEKEAENGKLE